MNDGPRGWGSPLYARVLDLTGVGPGTSVLDLGCGDGEFARAAVDRGALVTGVDLDGSAVAAASQRVPGAEFRVGDAHDPPAGPFDLTAAVQLLPHVADPVQVLRGARRVAPIVVATVWGQEEECDIRAFGEAMAPWLPPRPAPSGPLPLTDPDRLRAIVRQAGLEVHTLDVVMCPFHYVDEDALLGPLFASGIGRHVINRAGPVAVREAVLERLKRHRRPDGSFRLDNLFRIVVARRT